MDEHKDIGIQKQEASVTVSQKNGLKYQYFSLVQTMEKLMTASDIR